MKFLKYFVPFVFVLFFSTFSFADVENCQRENGKEYKCGNTWDLTLDLGYGDGDYSALASKVGFGWLNVNDPWLFSVRPFASFYYRAPWDFGLETEIMNLKYGVWGTLGISGALDKSLVLALGTGWSIFGIETQCRLNEKNNTLMFVMKIKVPISVILNVLDWNE